MPRKPIEHEVSGLRTPRERMWAAMRKQQRFTTKQLLAAIKPKVDAPGLKSYLQALVKAGYLAPETPDSERELMTEKVFLLVKDSWDAPRIDKAGNVVVQGLATLAMWRVMKALKEFDYHEVARTASVGDVVVKLETAKKYVNQLARAGYFRVVRQGGPNLASRFRLVRDTGAHAPAITRRKCVFDRNLGEFTLEESAQEVCDGLD